MSLGHLSINVKVKTQLNESIVFFNSVFTSMSTGGLYCLYFSEESKDNLLGRKNCNNNVFRRGNTTQLYGSVDG